MFKILQAHHYIREMAVSMITYDRVAKYTQFLPVTTPRPPDLPMAEFAAYPAPSR